MNKEPYARETSSRSSMSPQSSGGPPKLLRIRALYNLVNALATQVKKVCNLTQRLTLLSHLNNLRVSRLVRRRSWLERAPRPSWNLLQPGDSLLFQHALLISLADVAHPGADKYLIAIDNFDMNRGASGVAFALRELLQRPDVQIESRVVVHKLHFRTSMDVMRARMKNIYRQ